MIKLELTIAEVEMILKVLSKHPFEEVVGLILKIKNQGQPQAQEIVAAQENQ